MISVTACSSSDNDTQVSDTANTNETESGITETSTTDITPYIPDMTFDGNEFRIMYRFDSHAYNVTDIWVEGLNGEIINDSVYNRNIYIEDKFDVKIVPIPDPAPKARIMTFVQSGDDLCDLFSDRMYEIFPLMKDNYFYNLSELEYIDFEKPYWDKNSAVELMIGDKLNIVFGDFSLSASAGATFLYYNKDMLADYGFDLPYKYAYDGTWTYDKMLEMINSVAFDINGDGEMTMGDRFGMLTQVPYRLTCGFGVDFMERDDDNYITLAPLNDRTVKAFEDIAALLNDNVHTISYSSISGGNFGNYPHKYAYLRSEFVNGNILMFEGAIGVSAELTNMESLYGIMPMPKYDETQDRYYHNVDEYSCGWSVPITAQNIEMIDIVWEYMAYASNELVEATYDVTLKGKRLDSPDDVNMLDLVRDTTKYDISLIANVGVREMLEYALINVNLASTYEAHASAISQKLENLRN